MKETSHQLWLKGKETSAHDHDFSHIVEELALAMHGIGQPLSKEQNECLVDYILLLTEHAYNCAMCDACGVDCDDDDEELLQ